MIKETRLKEMRKRGRSALALLLVVLVTISMLNIPELTDVRAESESETTKETTTSETTTETKVEPQEGQQSEAQEGQQAEPNSGQQTEPTESTEPIEPTKPTETIEKTEIPETTTKIITAWQWTGSEDELNIQKDEVTGAWGIGISGGNEDTKVDFETVVSWLPTSITATIQNEEQNQEEQEDQEENEELTGEIALIWNCETYVQDETGKWPVSGDYIFEAGLPEGYSLADGNEKMKVVVQLGGAVVYAEGDNAGSYNVTGGTSGDDWVYDAENNSLTIQKSGTYTITGDSSTATKERIIVGDNLTVTLTVENVNCVMPVGSYNSGLAAMSISGTSTVTLILKGDNVFNSGYNHAGVEFSNAQDGSLTIQGDGKLTAVGGSNGAGIGGGHSGSGSEITINEGSVEARGGSSGAGIGGGFVGSGSKIIIRGGNVTAIGGTSGAGIGGGGPSGSGSEITINEGSVEARGGSNGAGIGGGSYGSGSKITISGGMVTAIGGDYGAGIGGGNSGSGSEITINEGSVEARGGSNGAGIGGGSNQSGSKITISGEMVMAIGGDYGAGIGGGGYGSGSEITINEGSVEARGGSNGAGIGGGFVGSGSEITISGGSVEAIGGSNGAGIGGGSSGYGSGSKITISGGTVTARGGSNGAGIGGGNSGSGTNITISSGTVTATGGNYGAGIGGGDSGSGSEIKIKGGSVKAVGGEGATSDIGSPPTNGAEEDVYLFKVDMEASSNIDSIGVDGNDWTRKGNHPNGDGTFDGVFYLYLTGENHLITVSGKNYLVKWNQATFTSEEYIGQIAPIPSISVSSTTNTITVSISDYNAKYGEVQYACIETGSTLKTSDWKLSTESSNIFENRELVTSYTCYARYAGNTTYYRSGYAIIVYGTAADKPAASVVTIDYINEVVTFEDIYEVNTSSDFTGTKIASGGSISDYIPAYGNTPQTLYVRVKAVPDGAGASESVSIAIPARPQTPNAVVTTTASTITVPQNDAWEYSRDNVTWTAWSNAYEVTELGAEQTQKFYVRVKATASTFASEVQTINATTNKASYTIRIPEGATAGGAAVEIKVNTESGNAFDLGNNGHVDVKAEISNNFQNGVLTLKYTGDEANVPDITSQMKVGGNTFTDLSKNIAVFRTKNDSAVAIQFEKPKPTQGDNICVGQYSGTVTFAITYSEEE